MWTDKDFEDLTPRRCRLLEWALIGAGVLAAFVSAASGARAETMNVIIGTPGYSVSGPKGSTVVAPLGSSAPHIIHLNDESKWSAVKKGRWYLRCRPKLRYDGLGVAHFIYAKAGCDVGLDRDPDYEEAVDANGNPAAEAR